LTQHNPSLVDGVPALQTMLTAQSDDGDSLTTYQKTHRVLAEGNFVLCASEGTREGVATAFYDLFRVEAGNIVEHWDTVEAIPPRSEWKNDNGKF
jgi:predicted SnoaL-like aldol condensation-catalyzing enzyme